MRKYQRKKLNKILIIINLLRKNKREDDECNEERIEERKEEVEDRIIK